MVILNKRKVGRLFWLAVLTLMVASPAQAIETTDDLLVRKCTTCHTAVRWQTARHTHIGWWAITARMRWINGASLTWSDQAKAVDLLVERFPATGDEARNEWLLAMLFVMAILLPVGWRVWRRKRAG